ncbi:MAG: Cache 3/Cache 2 fusion domain-containing protein [Desulfuromonadales bacterium]
MNTASVKHPLGIRLSIVLTLLIVLVMAVFIRLLTVDIKNRFEQHAEQELSQQAALLVNYISSYHASLADNAARLTSVFRSSFPGPFSRDVSRTIAIAGRQAPILRSGSTTLNLSRDIVDRFTQVTTAACTVFVRSGDDFIRIATSLKTEDGNRALGTVMERTHPAYPGLLKGSEYVGKATLFGRDYMTEYLPVKDSAGTVIAVLFIGLDFTESMKALKEKIRSTKIAHSGYFFAIDAQEGKEAGILRIHPALEGRQAADFRDPDNGREFVREILSKKTGFIRYHWMNQGTGERSPVEKIAAFRHIQEWNWIICASASLNDLKVEVQSVGNSMIRTILLAVAILVMSYLFVIRHWVTRPLAVFTRQIREVAEQDSNSRLRLDSKRGDELGLLADSFNSLLNELQHREQQLQKNNDEIRLINETLEVQVAQRVEELVRSELRFSSFVENANDVLFIMTPDGVFSYVSPQWQQEFGHELNEVIGQSFESFVHPDDVDRFADFLQQVLTSDKKHGGIEYRVRCMDGNYLWYTANASPVIDSYSGEISLFGIGRNISERKKRDLALQTSEKKYRSIIDSFDGLMYICSKEYRIEFMNRNLIERTGWDATGESCFKALHGLNSICSWCVNEQVFEGKTVHWDTRSPKDDRWYEIHNTPVYNADGTVSKQAIITDITERKLAEEELRRSKADAEAAKEQLSLSAKAGGVAFWEYDVITDKLHWDDQMYLLYGVRPDTFTNIFESWTALLHPDDVLRVYEEVRMALSGEKEFESDFRVIWPDYSMHNIFAAGKVQRDTAGQPLRMIGANWDITRTKMAEEEIKSFSRRLKAKNSELKEAYSLAIKANTAKSQFLSNMSHEIRTPLNAIIGFSTLMLKSTLPPDEHDFIKKINTAGETLLNIINDILDYSKIEAGQLVIEETAFMLDTKLANVIDMVQHKSADKGLNLLVRRSPDVASCLIGDPLRLGQIVVNLLSNAVKFTERGEVMLETKLLKQADARQQIKFTIRDTGIGISPEQINKLFQPFTQADESTTRRFGGTGLGLSICKQLVELMGGEIWCESTPGLGSTFSFTAWFGLCQESDLAQCISHCNLNNEDTRHSYDFSTYHILLVEDNEINQQLATELLKDTGVGVTVASNGAEAVAAVTEGNNTFDMILMDIQMPVMDGYEATRLIRADSRFTALPIIAMTAHAMLEEQQKVLTSGMDAHIPKPIDVRALLRVMRLFLGVQTVDMPLSKTHDESDGGAAEIPVIAGFDVAAALDRLDGNEKLFRWLLRSFVENKADAVKIIEEALSSGDTTLAARHAHTLKSSAGSIGAVELESLAQNLENAIELEESAEIVSVALRQFAIEMERVVAFLADTLPPAAPGSDNSLSPGSVDGAAVTPVLQQLLLCIQGSDCIVEQYLDDHQNELKSLPKQDMDMLGKHLKNFDFTAAQEALLALAEKHGIVLESRTP